MKKVLCKNDVVVKVFFIYTHNFMAKLLILTHFQGNIEIYNKTFKNYSMGEVDRFSINVSRKKKKKEEKSVV